MSVKNKGYMKDVKFIVDHGSIKKGQVLSYHKSTTEALVAHKIVEIVKDTPIVKNSSDILSIKHDVKV